MVLGVQNLTFVGHAKDALLVVAITAADFIFKWFTKNRFTSFSSAGGVTALKTKPGNKSVEAGVIVISIFAMNNKIFTSFGRNFTVQLKIEGAIIGYNSNVSIFSYTRIPEIQLLEVL